MCNVTQERRWALNCLIERLCDRVETHHGWAPRFPVMGHDWLEQLIEDVATNGNDYREPSRLGGSDHRGTEL